MKRKKESKKRKKGEYPWSLWVRWCPDCDDKWFKAEVLTGGSLSKHDRTFCTTCGKEKQILEMVPK